MIIPLLSNPNEGCPAYVFVITLDCAGAICIRTISRVMLRNVSGITSQLSFSQQIGKTRNIINRKKYFNFGKMFLNIT